MADVKVTIPRGDSNPNQRTDIDVEVVNPDGSVSARTVKGAVQSTTEEDGTVTFGILASAHVPFTAGGGTYEDEVLADSPLVYLRLNESSGSSAADSSGNSRTFDVVGTYTWGETGLIASDSANECINLDTSGAIGLGYQSWMLPGNSITVEAWINADTWPTTWVPIASQRSSGSVGVSTCNWQLRVFDAGSGRKARFFVTSGSDVYEAVGSTTLSTGTTYHIAGTFDGTTVKVYVNGSEDGSAAASVTMNSANISTRFGSTEYAGESWDGDLDELAFYGTALSGTRIAAHYAAA